MKNEKEKELEDKLEELKAEYEAIESIEEPQEENFKLICLSNITKEYGIPRKTIEELLPEPYEERMNPYYRSASPMKLYRVMDVERIIRDVPEVREAIERHKNLSKRSKKAVETKLEKMRERIREAIWEIKVDVSDGDVEELAIEHFNEFESYKEFNYSNYTAEYINCGRKKSKHKLNREFLDRITVNYIRHELTDYDEELYDSKGMVGTHEFYFEYKNALMDKIAEAYPKYKKECERQKMVKLVNVEDDKDNKENKENDNDKENVSFMTGFNVL